MYRTAMYCAENGHDLVDIKVRHVEFLLVHLVIFFPVILVVIAKVVVICIYLR